MAGKQEVEELAGRIRPLVAGERAIVEKRMFGGIAFLLNGNLAVSSSGNGGLMLRCEPSDTSALVAEPGVSRVVMRGRAMDGWIRVDAARVREPRDLERWVRVGVDYAGSLPAKD